MKKLLFFMLLFISLNLFAIEGIWEFDILFMQIILKEGATFEKFDIDIIKRIGFTNNASNKYFRQGIIELLDVKNTTKLVYNNYIIDYREENNTILLFLSLDKEIMLTINVLPINETEAWFSYSLSKEILNGKLSQPENINNEYLNYIGIMRKIK